MIISVNLIGREGRFTVFNGMGATLARAATARFLSSFIACENEESIQYHHQWCEGIAVQERVPFLEKALTIRQLPMARRHTPLSLPAFLLA
jgi:hypothetical protein